MKEVKETYQSYSKEEEWVNIITHGIGIALGVVGYFLLLFKENTPETIVYYISVTVYCATFVWTYTTSTVYHSLNNARIRLKNAFHLLDHTAIYLFIAGTYTPISVYFLPKGWSIFILIAIWTLALAGLIFKFFSIGKFNKLSTYLYLAMGWLIVIALKPLLDTAPINLIWWIVAGGVCYSLGTIFFLKDSLKYAHGIWHVWVLAGSICHFCGIYLYI